MKAEEARSLVRRNVQPKLTYKSFNTRNPDVLETMFRNIKKCCLKGDSCGVIGFGKKLDFDDYDYVRNHMISLGYRAGVPTHNTGIFLMWDR